MLTLHATQQLAARFPDPQERHLWELLADTAAKVTADLPGVTAVRLGDCPKRYCPDGSNGSQVVAPCQAGVVITVYFRRPSQGCPPRADRLVGPTDHH